MLLMFLVYFKHRIVLIKIYVMKKKKVFIISYNNLPIEFWNEHLNFDSCVVWLWSNDTDQAINNISSVLPDVVIVDGYWAKKSILKNVRYLISKKYISNIFYITPKRESILRMLFLDQRLHVSRFTNDVLDDINSCLNPFQEGSPMRLNKIA